MTTRNRASAFQSLGIEPLEDASPADSTQSVVPSDPISGGRRNRSSAFRNIGLDSDDQGAIIPPPVAAPPIGVQPVAAPIAPEAPGFFDTLGDMFAARTDAQSQFTQDIPQLVDNVVPDPMQRGFYRARQAFELGNTDTTDPYDFADTLIETSKQIAKYPMDADTQEALQIANAPGQSFTGAAKTLLGTKGGYKAIASVVAESIVQYAPALVAAGVTGAITKNPWKAAAAASPFSYANTYNTALLDEMRKAGADPDDPANRDKIAALVSDEAFWDRATKSAIAYGVPIEAANFLSLGLAGRLLGPAIQRGGVARILGAGTGEVGFQAAAGAAGEAGGQGGQILVGARDQFAKGEIVMEGLAEGPIGAVEIAIQTPLAVRASKEIQAEREAAEQEQQTLANAVASEDVAMAFDPTPGQGANINMELNTGGRNRTPALERLGMSIPSEPEATSEAPVMAAPAIEPEVPATETPVLPDPVETPQNETPPAGQTSINLGDEITAQPVGDVREVTTVNNSERLNVRPVIVDINDLRQAEGDLQPRDRSLKESQIGAAARARDLDPQQLGDSPVGDSGAPIVLKDGTILSGNGRVLTLQQVLKDPALADQKAKYFDFLRGYQSTVDPDRAFDPILVMQVEDDIDSDTAIRFAQDNNISRVAQMSATEQAQLDADRISDDMIRLYTGGEIESRENRQFLDAFIRDLVAENERNSFSRDGRLTKEGAQRIEAAILARAYKDKGVLSNILESRDDNIRNITSAMLSAAPRFAQLQGEIAAGRVEAEYDITPAVVEVAQTISRLRKEGVKVQDYLNQQDAFSDRDPVVDALIAAFYDGNRALSAQKLAAVLDEYVNEASKKETGGFFEDETTAEDVIGAARKKVDSGKRGDTDDQISIFSERQSSNVTGARESRQTAERPENETRSESPDRRGSETEGRDQEVTRQVVPASAPFSGKVKNTKGAKIVSVIEPTIHAEVFAQAGISADNALNLPVNRQFKIIQQVFNDRFGLSVDVDERVSKKDAVTRLIEAYVAMENMATALNVPAKIIGLNGRLKFTLENSNNKGALAYFRPSTNEIYQLIGANSFAHEWFHALDFWIMDSYGGAPLGGARDAGQSGRTRGVRGDEQAFRDGVPKKLRDALERVMRTMYADKAGEAHKIKQLQNEIMRLEAKGRETGKQYKALEEARRKLKTVLEGRGGTRVERGGMSQRALDGPMKDYFNMPTEMFARAGEAFVARQVELMGGKHDIMTPGDAYYDAAVEEFIPGRDANYINRIYPQHEERMEIFGAFTDLIQAVYETGMFGKRDMTDTGQLEALADPFEAWNTVPQRFTQGVMGNMFDEYNRTKRQDKRARDEQIRLLPQPKGKDKGLIARGWEKWDFVGSATRIRSADRHMVSMYGRYGKAIKPMEYIISQVTANRGGTTPLAKGGTVFERHSQKMNQFSAKLQRIMEQFDLDDLPREVQVILRDFLIGEEKTINLNIKFEGADYDMARPARLLRQLMDEIHTYMRKANVNVGYLQDGSYLPRILNDDVVIANQDKFNQQAEKVYAVLFDNELGGYQGTEAQARELISRLTGATIAQMNNEAASFVAKLKRHFKAIDNEESAIVSDEEIQQRLQNVYDEAKKAESKVNTAKWFERISIGTKGDPFSSSVAADFTKQRALPKEADKLLEDFYYSNPIDAIQQYIISATRKAEYTRSFGKHLIPEGKNVGNQYPSLLEYLHDEMIRQGVDSSVDAPAFIRAAQLAMGINVTATSRNAATNKFGDVVSGMIAVPLLTLAAVSSLPEPMVTGLMTGRTQDGFKAFNATIGQLFMRLTNRERYETMDSVARIVGVIADSEFNDVVQNRIGGGYLSNSSFNKWVTRFFINNLLSPLTNAQRRIMPRIWSQYFLVQSEKVKKLEGKQLTDGDKRFIQRFKNTLRDIGVPEANFQEFVDYVLEIHTNNGKVKHRDPQLNDFVDPSGRSEGIKDLYSLAMYNAANISITNPTPGQKSMLAQDPTGRVIFSVLSFLWGFYSNTVIRHAQGVQRDLIDNPKKVMSATSYIGLKVAAPVFALAAVHLVISSLREYGLNRDRWEEKKREGELEKYLLELAFSRTGLLGPYDPIYNSIRSLKYQRDIANAVVGAGSYYLQNTEKIIEWAVNDTDSLYDDYQGWQGLYAITAVPLFSFMLAASSSIVPRPVAQTTLYPALSYIRSPDSKRDFANQMLRITKGREYVPGKKKKPSIQRTRRPDRR